ncbi:hypothetical protein [Aquimarina sp. SS2-1]|uniref:hypothetical protein n=1 Tax=Aquimarina besae TaxID=3342247 RepID=UPI00367250A6
MIVLEATVEFEPWDWIGEKAHKIIGTTEWNSYWDDFLKTLGIKPAYSGSWLISIDEINKPEIIKKIVTLTCNDDFSTENIDNSLPPFTGGYILFDNNKVLFEPQCCCDLGDLDYWKELTSLESENWHNLLMGHAMMHARKVGDNLEIKEIPEYGNHEPIIEKVNQSDLRIAISKVEQKIKSFEKTIFPIINEIYNNDELSLKISKKFTGQS